MGRGTTPDPRHFAHTGANSQAPLAIYLVPARICKQSGHARRTHCFQPMSPFNFQSIQSLELSSKDNPIIDVRDGHLVITAERGQEKIMITAPLQGIVPKVSATTVKTSQVRKPGFLRGHSINKGSQNPIAKLNEDTVKEIRTLLADPDFVNSYNSFSALDADLARSYNVSATAIYSIRKGNSWKHVAV